MAALLLLVSLASCAVIWAAAMFFYMRHDRPTNVREHYGQVALLFVAVGAFASGVRTLKFPPGDAWSVLFLLGIAMFAARSLWSAWLDLRSRP
jgi:hypothetical protein